MEAKLIQFIKREFLSDPDLEITAETRLISSGLVDSFSLVSLQRFIESEFGVLVPAPRITAETFDTVGQMIEVIARFR